MLQVWQLYVPFLLALARALIALPTTQWVTLRRRALLRRAFAITADSQVTNPSIALAPAALKPSNAIPVEVLGISRPIVPVFEWLVERVLAVLIPIRNAT